MDGVHITIQQARAVKLAKQGGFHQRGARILGRQFEATLQSRGRGAESHRYRQVKSTRPRERSQECERTVLVDPPSP